MKQEKQIHTIHALLEQRKIDRDMKTIEIPVKVHVDKYRDPEYFQKELDTAFRDYPLVAGHVAKVKEPGQYILSEWKKFPYVIVRDKDHKLRGFLNVCQHRGAPLVSGKEENLMSFVCPYHGWNYGLDGKLKGVYKPYNFPDLDCDKHNLVELPVVERHGLVWIHPTPGAEINIPKFLGEDFDEDVEHFNLEGLELHQDKAVTLNANWKLLLKTYLDRYHVPILHKNSIAPFFQQGVIAHHLHEPHIRISAGLTNLPEAVNQDPQDWNILNYASVLYTFFPNTYLINHSDLVSLNRFYPVAPDKTIWCHGMYYRKGSYQGEEGQKALTERFANIDAVFGHEDFGIAESCQTTLDFGQEYHTLGLEEGLLAIFQDSVDKVVSKA